MQLLHGLTPIERGLPEGTDDGQPYGLLLGLASSGVYTASSVTREAVVSYTAIPPLPAMRAVSFLLHFPWSRLHRTLSGTLPCEARTFLTLRRDHLWYSQLFIVCLQFTNYTLNIEPPINSLMIECLGISSGLIVRK